MIPKKAATVVIHLMEENSEQILLSSFTAEKKKHKTSPVKELAFALRLCSLYIR